MYMPNINTAKQEQEDPKNPNTIAKNIFKGFLYICLAILIFTISSWQLSILVAAGDCFSSDKSGCPYPGNENAAPYRGVANKRETPFQAFLNILMAVTGEGLIGLSRGVKCCKPTKGGMIAPPNSVYRGGRKKQTGGGKIQTGGNSSIGDEISNISIQWGGSAWKPFDIHGKKIGWPYSEIGGLQHSFGYWLGKSQITSWVMPRQLFQSILLFLLNFMVEAMGDKGAWIGRFIITLILPLIFCFSVFFSGIVAFFSSIWGGFFQHILDGNLAGLVWGFFCTWAIAIFNMTIQPLELLLSLFIIPAMRGGPQWVKRNWNSMHDGHSGYREIVLTSAFIAFAGMVLYNLMPLLNKKK